MEPNSPARDNAGVLILPPVLFALIFGVALLLEQIGWPRFLPSPPLDGIQFIVGLLLTGIGGTFDLVAISQFLKARTHILPNQPTLNLVTGGIYRLTRNPMYVGLLFVLAGTSLIFALEWGLMLWPLMAAILHFGVVLREEKYLTAKFGAPYQDFVNLTRRWLW